MTLPTLMYARETERVSATERKKGTRPGLGSRERTDEDKGKSATRCKCAKTESALSKNKNRRQRINGQKTVDVFTVNIREHSGR